MPDIAALATTSPSGPDSVRIVVVTAVTIKCFSLVCVNLTLSPTSYLVVASVGTVTVEAEAYVQLSVTSRQPESSEALASRSIELSANLAPVIAAPEAILALSKLPLIALTIVVIGLL